MKKQRGKQVSKLLLSALVFLSCACGEKKQPKIVDAPSSSSVVPSNHECEWGPWEIVDEPTCIDEGLKERHCFICGKTETAVMPVDREYGHKYVESPDDDLAATCTKNGVEGSMICERCGAKKAGTVIEKTGHNLGNWKVTKEASETEKGIRERECSKCGYKVTEEFELEVPPTNKYPTENYYDGYYVPISYWENGEDLKNQLHALISKDFTGLVYEGNWETNQVADCSLTDLTKVDAVYLTKDENKNNTYTSTNVKGWQREHAFCASLMTGYNTGDAVGVSSNGSSRATDFHNLFASYGPANGSRGNKNFGNTNLYGNSVSRLEGSDSRYDEKNYEPSDADKGRLVRAIFYMGVMYNSDEESSITVKYNFGNSNSKNIKITAKYKPLQIVENYIDYSQVTFNNFCRSNEESCQNLRSTYLSNYREDTSAYNVDASPDETILNDFGKAYADYRYNEGPFAIGNLSTLLKWNSYDVDRLEMQHNEKVYSYVHNLGNNSGKKQGNRNPFVDYPQLVDYIFGDKKDEPGSLSDLCPSQEKMHADDKGIYGYALADYKNEYVVGETLTSSDYHIARINNDFSIEAQDFVDYSEPYTFTKSDVGTKKITVQTPVNSLTYEVKVLEHALCNYNFMITNSGLFSSTKINKTPAQLLSYGGVSYNLSAGIDNCNVKKASGKDYVQIGTSSDHADTLTIESTKAFEYEEKKNISAVYLGLNTASGTTYNYAIYINNELVIDGEFGYSQEGAQLYGGEINTPKSGVLKIVLSKISKAVYLSQISVKVN
ncbi:MAG: endonuclease [Bacilli bacterium]|nr:endonuclease [Bacilli bacterium]